MYCLHHEGSDDLLEEKVPCELCGYGGSLVDARSLATQRLVRASDSLEALHAVRTLQETEFEGDDVIRAPRFELARHYW